jgi:hypothetical protein
MNRRNLPHIDNGHLGEIGHDVSCHIQFVRRALLEVRAMQKVKQSSRLLFVQVQTISRIESAPVM